MEPNKEYLTRVEGNEAPTCLCGNQGHRGGYMPCDANGNEADVGIESGWGNPPLYACEDCGRFYNDEDPTLEVLGRNPNPTRLIDLED
jgi:hypothetical protein